MARLTRRSAISVAMEGTYGGTPGSYQPILLVGTPDFTIDPDVVPRGLLRGYFGASEELTGTRMSILKFTTEVAAGSALGTAPLWSFLLRGSGWAETITASTRVEYLPITDAMESIAIKYNRDGVQYLCKGARGTGKLNFTAYDRPVIDWEYRGFDTQATAVAVGTPSFSNWTRPVVITDANSGDITLGSTYSAGAVSGGTAYPSRGMMLDFGNTVEQHKMLAGEAIEITDRQMSGEMTVELTAAQEVTWRTDINANTLSSLSFAVGPAGNKVAIHMPSVQRTKPQMVDYNGKVLMKTDLRIMSTVAGNNECRIIIS